ncbi:MAG: alpha-galactosidase [Opitutales bacterium]
MAIKVAFIGAGSIGFTRKLCRDILTVPEFADAHFALHDINRRNLNGVAQLLEKDIASNRLPARVTRHHTRKPALAGADYVVNTTRIGGLDAFAQDIDIPLRYGIDQCVGDTLCAGGIFYGQRNIPAIEAFCADMQAEASDDVLFLNYANPMAMNTWAALDTGVNTVGLCHGVQGSHGLIARVLGAESKDEVDVVAAGINHQTWFVDIRHQGRRISGEELLAAFEADEDSMRDEKCRIDVLRRFGFWSTESNGHLSEYLPWYRKRAGEIEKWISLGTVWIHGETGGYLRVCTEGRNWFEQEFDSMLAEAGEPIEASKRSEEHGSYIIEALETGRPYRGHFNVRNGGTITNLAADAIIEAPGYVDRHGIHMTPVGELPLACAATCTASIDVQRMSVRAAQTGDSLLLRQALLHDPLTAAICDPDEIWHLCDAMLDAQADWLPQFEATGAIAAARKRLKAGPDRARFPDFPGAARLETRDIDAMRAEVAGDAAARKRMTDADKAGFSK